MSLIKLILLFIGMSSISAAIFYPKQSELTSILLNNFSIQTQQYAHFYNSNEFSNVSLTNEKEIKLFDQQQNILREYLSSNEFNTSTICKPSCVRRYLKFLLSSELLPPANYSHLVSDPNILNDVLENEPSWFERLANRLNSAESSLKARLYRKSLLDLFTYMSDDALFTKTSRLLVHFDHSKRKAALILSEIVYSRLIDENDYVKKGEFSYFVEQLIIKEKNIDVLLTAFELLSNYDWQVDYSHLLTYLQPIFDMQANENLGRALKISAMWGGEVEGFDSTLKLFISSELMDNKVLALTTIQKLAVFNQNSTSQIKIRLSQYKPYLLDMVENEPSGSYCAYKAQTLLDDHFKDFFAKNTRLN